MITLNENAWFCIMMICIFGGMMGGLLSLAQTDVSKRPIWRVLSIGGLIIMFLGVPAGYQYEKVESEHYFNCVKDNYTIFLDGEEVAHPDKIRPNKYSIVIDDDKKEVILTQIH